MSHSSTFTTFPTTIPKIVCVIWKSCLWKSRKQRIHFLIQIVRVWGANRGVSKQRRQTGTLKTSQYGTRRRYYTIFHPLMGSGRRHELPYQDSGQFPVENASKNSLAPISVNPLIQKIVFALRSGLRGAIAPYWVRHWDAAIALPIDCHPNRPIIDGCPCDAIFAWSNLSLESRYASCSFVVGIVQAVVLQVGTRTKRPT